MNDIPVLPPDKTAPRKRKSPPKATEDLSKLLFRFRTAQGKKLEAVFETLYKLVGDANLRFVPPVGKGEEPNEFDLPEGGIFLFALDGSHVAVSVMTLDAREIAETGAFYCRPGKPVLAGVHLETLCRCLKSLGPKDTLVLKMTEAEPDKLVIIGYNTERRETQEFRINTLDIQDEILNIPAQEFDVILTMSTTDLQKRIKTLKLMESDSLTMETKTGRLIFAAKGDRGEAELTLEPQEHVIDIQSVKNHLKLEFSLKILELFSNADGVSRQVTLYLLEAHPLMMEYQMESLGKLVFVLAPKVSDDEAK